MIFLDSNIYEFKAKIQDQVYYKDDSNWGIYKFTTEDDIPQYTEHKDIFNEYHIENLKESKLVGRMQQLYIGSEYQVTAKLEYNNKYRSWQYNPTNVAAIIPKTSQQQKSFLESLVTKRQAEVLLEAYPNIVEDVINGKTDDIDLNKIHGIKEYTWNFIKEKIINNYVVSDILTMLQPLGITYSMIKKLLMNYGNTTLLKQELLNNPYILTKIHGLGFKRVDGLALKLKPELIRSHKRTYAFLNYYLKEIGEQNGHTWITFDQLENSVRDNILECEELYQEILDIERKTQALLYIDDEQKRIGLKYYRDIEISIYSILQELDSFKNDWDINDEDIQKGIKEAEEELGFELSLEQKEVIKDAINHNITVISGKAGCVDCDTEFFNGYGWKKISNYQERDKVLQYNEDGTAELVEPSQYHKYEANYLWHFETKYGLDQCLSDEHEVYYITSKNNLYHKPFKEVRENHEQTGFKGRFITTFNYNDQGLLYNEWEIRLKVAIKADGSFKNHYRPYDCYVNIKKQRKKGRIEFLLNKNNIEYEILDGAEGYSIYKFYYEDNEKTFTPKWYNCSQEQFKIIFDEIFYWDGEYDTKNRWFTTIKEDADFIQFVGTICGYKTSIGILDRVNQEYLTNNKIYTRKSIEYNLSFTKVNLISLCIDRRLDHTITPINQYKTIDGYKYCFTVPSHMLVLRRNNKIFVTGNSGKTTISRALLKIYKNANKTIGCASLSAKAAQRITEATGFPASTIHRLLGAKGFNEFAYNYQHPLPYEVILADEGSMNNAKIMYDLISALKPGTKLIISGDCRQLPPIGFGNIFSDLLELKNKFHIYELTKVHRQAEKSGILTDANLIREGINPIQQPELKIIHGELQDMYYMFRENRDALHEIAINMFLKSIKTDGLDNVIIITPRKKDCINSTREINIKIQDSLIGDNQFYLTRGNLKFKLGAKVIQRVNNYDKNIFNGEIGYIIEIDNNKFIVEYLNKTIEYSKSELDQIEHAYCLTCHLSQGSGYQTVIVIIDNTHYSLLDSCLLYTALTRAKQRCLLLAEPSAFKRCINQNNSIIRQTWLKELNDEIVELTIDNINKINREYNESKEELFND